MEKKGNILEQPLNTIKATITKKCYLKSIKKNDKKRKSNTTRVLDVVNKYTWIEG